MADSICHGMDVRGDWVAGMVMIQGSCIAPLLCFARGTRA